VVTGDEPPGPPHRRAVRLLSPPIRGGSVVSVGPMNPQVVYQGDHDGGGVTADMVSELCGRVLASLPRSDQRRRGELYIWALLSTEGRKSMRNLATLVGGPAAEQSLHHFISKSTWDWGLVRRALARHLEQVMAPQAWVVEPVSIRKAGDRSVGVDLRFVPGLGRMVNSQQAYGVWLTSAQLSVPVNWRLLLSRDWLEDGDRRRRAEIPEQVSVDTPVACAQDAMAELRADWRLRQRPVLMDVRDADAARVATDFHAAGIPFLLRVSGSTPLLVGDRAMPHYGAGPVPAQRVVESIRGLGRPVEWIDPVGSALRTGVAVAARVSVPQRVGAPTPMALLGEWTGQYRRGGSLWLTNMTEASVGALLRLTKLTRRVAHDLAEVCDPAGIRDFEGRSFGGWHRHTTLVSVAHAASVLARAERSGPRPALRYASAVPA
jgi:hypothetical protein